MSSKVRKTGRKLQVRQLTNRILNKGWTVRTGVYSALVYAPGSVPPWSVSIVVQCNTTRKIMREEKRSEIDRREDNVNRNNRGCHGKIQGCRGKDDYLCNSY